MEKLSLKQLQYLRTEKADKLKYTRRLWEDIDNKIQSDTNKRDLYSYMIEILKNEYEDVVKKIINRS